MRLVVVGAGAVGSYVGGSLAAAGHDLTFLARGATAEALRERGLRLTPRPGAPAQTLAVSVVTSWPEALALLPSPPECLILATKAYDTAAVIEQIKSQTATPPPILCLQNGVDGEAELAEAFGHDRVIAGTVTTPVSVPQAGVAAVEKVRGMGVARGHSLSSPLAAVLNGAGIRTKLYPAAGPMKWSKLITNLLGNATAAITDLPVTAILADPGLYAVERASIEECLAVMRSYQNPVVNLPGVPVKLLAWAMMRLPTALAQRVLTKAVGGGRGGKQPSLHLDLQAGRQRTEVGWLHGAVARHAALRGLEAPVNAILTETVEGLAAGRLDRDAYRGREKLLALVAQHTQPPA